MAIEQNGSEQMMSFCCGYIGVAVLTYRGGCEIDHHRVLDGLEVSNLEVDEHFAKFRQRYDNNGRFLVAICHFLREIGKE
jgi:hypothetical protein